MKLQDGEFNRLDTHDPHTLQLSWLEGWYVDCVVQQRFVQGHYGKGVQTPTTFREVKVSEQVGEAFGFMCIHISSELLFHLDGLNTPREV